MKLTYLLLLLFGCFSSMAQPLDSIGIDDNPVLNSSEAQLLQSLRLDTTNGYDLTHMKAAFITGSAASRFETKSDFFQHSIKPWTANGDNPSMSVIMLAEEEKLLSGGYDVLVLAWVMVF